MDTPYYSILTPAGRNLFTRALAGYIKLQFAGMAVGDGNGILPQPSPSQTALVRETWRGSLTGFAPDPRTPGQFIAEMVIPEAVGGWWVREVALYDAEGTVCCIGNCPPTYKPLLAEGAARSLTVRMPIRFGSSSNVGSHNVEIHIDPDLVLASRVYVDATLSSALAAQWERTEALVTAAVAAHHIALRKEEIGRIVFEARATPRSGYLLLNGAVLYRSDYADLWAYAQTSGALVPDALWWEYPGCFSTGDDDSTFRIPDFRGEFLRCWDAGSGVDKGRALGTWQDSQNRTHTHMGEVEPVPDHSHEAWTQPAGWHDHQGQTGTAGTHTHNYQVPPRRRDQIGEGARAYTAWLVETKLALASTEWAGNHEHYILAEPDHFHAVGMKAAGGHTHRFTLQADGGAEVRVRNIAVSAMIRAY